MLKWNYQSIKPLHFLPLSKNQMTLLVSLSILSYMLANYKSTEIYFLLGAILKLSIIGFIGSSQSIHLDWWFKLSPIRTGQATAYQPQYQNYTCIKRIKPNQRDNQMHWQWHSVQKKSSPILFNETLLLLLLCTGEKLLHLIC